MNRFETQESFVAEFIVALTNAGMQAGAGADLTKPRYFRGYVPPERSTDALFLRYNIDENNTLYFSDDKDFIREIVIGGEVYTRNGYGDSDYQDLCEDIEDECVKKGFAVEWENESTDASFDANSPISIKRFSVTKNKA